MLQKSSSIVSEALQEAPAWAVSLGIHTVLLLLMASITYVVQDPTRHLLVDSSLDDPIDEQYLFDATVADQLGTESNFDTLAASLAATQDPTQAEKDPVQEKLEEELLEVEVPNVETVMRPSDAELVEAVEVTGQTEHTGGVEGAMDRLTMEIAASLKDKPTLAIWLFDASQSLNERREAIAKRFEIVYKQLGMFDLEKQGKTPLETAVLSYGEETKFITDQPVRDVKDLVKAIREIKPDTSGKEFVFDAVNKATNRWSSYKTKLRRNVMMIIVTDERGDDLQNLEVVINTNKRLGIPVYCVGNAAVFGRDQEFVKFTWEENGQTYTDYLPADKGPETIYPERLQLPFFGGNQREFDQMSASFGPYALTRLCAETGGLYLVSADVQEGPNFDPALMRPYAPDYRPVRLVDLDVKKNKAKQALLLAAQRTRVNTIPIPTLRFRADTDNILRQELTEAQKPLAVLDYQLQELMGILEVGVPDRSKLAEPRWRAGYDLAVGRVLAMRARVYGYNEMCAEMKSNPKAFENKENNHWQLVASDTVSAGSTVKKLAAQAEEYLSRVIKEHPGTPWELLASREMQQPLGWEWREYHMDVAPMNSDDSDKPMLLLAEEERKKMMANQPPKPKNIPKL
ncbi:MAG: VWA domain-containing protein [Planctomycetaceae bacterium]|nr:VWA domain-containing protein [Planctomycetaceae bacterium]